jgi:cytochrome P450
MITSPKPTLPGSTGLPLIGETIAFAKDQFGFIAERVGRHGPVFQTSILGKHVVILSGPAGCEAFANPDNVKREGGMPAHVQELFAGLSLPALDGEIHRNRKLLVLEGFTRDAIAAYLPEMQATVERYLEHWLELGEFSWIDELKRLSMEIICRNVLSIDDPATLDAIRADYMVIGEGFAGLPVPLPMTKYGKALAARDRLMARFREIIRQHRQSPSNNGLSRMLAAKTPDGVMLSDEEAALELHHVLVAGFIVYAVTAQMIIGLSRQAAVRRRVHDEVMAAAASGAITPRHLAKLPYLMQAIDEAKRVTPILPAIFGVAKRPFECQGYEIPAGSAVWWALRETHRDPAVYSDPDTFDPGRFSAARAEHKKHPFAFAPQGPGPDTGHKCPGTDYSTVLIAVITIAMLRGYGWDLPPQNMQFNWQVTPPEPVDGLKVRFRKATSKFG